MPQKSWLMLWDPAEVLAVLFLVSSLFLRVPPDEWALSWTATKIFSFVSQFSSTQQERFFGLYSRWSLGDRDGPWAESREDVGMAAVLNMECRESELPGNPFDVFQGGPGCLRSNVWIWGLVCGLHPCAVCWTRRSSSHSDIGERHLFTNSLVGLHENQ